MSAGFDWYSRIVQGMMPSIGQRRGQEQRFNPNPVPQMSQSSVSSAGPSPSMGLDPMGTFMGMMPPTAPEYDGSDNSYLTNPQSGASAMNDPNSLTPSSYARPSFRQSEIESMNAYRKMQNAGRMAPPVKAQAPGAQAGFYYLDDGQGNVRPYGYASSAPMIPGYNAVIDPNGKQTFGGPQAPQAQAPASSGGFIDPLTREMVGGAPSSEGFFAKLLRGFSG